MRSKNYHSMFAVGMKNKIYISTCPFLVKKKFLLRSPEHPFKRKAQNSQFYKVTCTFFVNKGGKKKTAWIQVKKRNWALQVEKKKND